MGPPEICYGEGPRYCGKVQSTFSQKWQSDNPETVVVYLRGYNKVVAAGKPSVKLLILQSEHASVEAAGRG